MGSNGLDPLDQLRERDKCPEAPSKTKYHDSQEAWKAAGKRSSETGLEIVPYACPGCGLYHLTKNKTGSDVLAKTPVGITTGALRKAMPTPIREVPERIELPNVTPIVPGNKEARQKALALYLKERDTATGGELLKVLGIKSTSSLGPYMRAQGWEVSSHGRGAYWRRAKPLTLSRTLETTHAEQAKAREQWRIAQHLEAGTSTHSKEHWHAEYPSKDAGWRPVDLNPLSPTMTLKDLLDVYKSAGLEFRLQVRDTDHTNGSGA